MSPLSLFCTMNQHEYIKEFGKVLQDMLTITSQKNKDYAGISASDAFRNFKLSEVVGVASVEEGFIVRMLDKVQRAANLLKQDNAVVDEKITDTLLDLAVYSIMLKIYISNK